MRHPKLSAWSWSMPMMEISTRKSVNMRGMALVLAASRWFRLFRRWSWVSKPSTTPRSVIGTWSALTFSWPVRAKLNSATSMFQRSFTEACYTHRQELLIMQALRCGKTSLTTRRATSGPSDAFSTRCWLREHLSNPIVWRSYTKKWYKPVMLRSRTMVISCLTSWRW